MSSTLFLGALCLMGIIGICILLHLKQLKIEKNQSHQVSSFVIDGIRVFGLRSFSSLVQLLIYTTLVLRLFSSVFNQPFSWHHIASFFCGGLAMSLSLFIVAGLVPKLIPTLIDKSKGYLKDGLQCQLNSVFMLGFSIIAIILFIFFLLFHTVSFQSVIGYGFGIIFSSFFIRIGGGLFKASADIGKSTSKILHPSLPHDHDSNPGLLLDISGDYIGKICGFCSDIIGSFIMSIIAMLLFSEAFTQQQLGTTSFLSHLQSLPFYILAISIFGNILGFLLAKWRIHQHAFQNVLLESLYTTIIICGIGTYMVTQAIPNLTDTSIWTGIHTFKPFLAYIIGLVGAFFICFTSEVLTSYRYPTSKNLAQHAEFKSPITHILSLSMGLRNNGIFLMYLLLITGTSYIAAGLYGIALASMGMLCVTTNIISINSFGPLASSTYNIAKLSTTSTTVLNHTNKMRSIGQSTIAIGNGFSSAIAIMATLSLFLSLVCYSPHTFSDLMSINMLWLVGLIAGLILPLCASGFLLKTLTRAILFIVKDIKSQFEHIPFLKEGKAKPDIVHIADQTARKCMDGLIIPGILIAFIPITIGYLINLPMLIAIALGSFLCGAGLTFYWATSGDVINNAKHYIENGHCGGPESSSFSCIKDIDCIADAYKDVLSPSLNIMIKSIMILAVVMMLFLQ